MEQYIPKVIHYSWFGGKEKPAFIRKCISTWEKKMPGYRIVEWNESNFNLEEHPFALDAYRAKKYAFVSDYPRIGEALVLYFTTPPQVRPIRPHRYAEYAALLAAWENGAFPLF